MRGPDVFVVADNVFTPLGKTTASNFANLKKSISAVREHRDTAISQQSFYAALFDKNESVVSNAKDYTKFEQLLIASIEDALNNGGLDASDKKTVLIISSTK